MLVKPQSDSRFYLANDDGIKPFYEIAKKSGEMRKPNVGDARKLGALVSVTTVCKVIAKPFLDKWGKEQVVYSALTLPKLADEAIDNYAVRVVADADSVSRKAREFGTAIHDQIEYELVTLDRYCPPALDPFMVGIRKWLDENVSQLYAAESIIGDVTIGIAGRLDLHCRLATGHDAVIDFKSSSNMEVYPEFPLQLSAYSHCVRGKSYSQDWPQLITVLIPSKTPGPVETKTWEDPQRYWGLFQHCFEIWKYINNYYPSGETA